MGDGLKTERPTTNTGENIVADKGERTGKSMCMIARNYSL